MPVTLRSFAKKSVGLAIGPNQSFTRVPDYTKKNLLHDAVFSARRLIIVGDPKIE